MTTKDEALKLALEAAYLAGFNASGEGYNGEYPFQDHNAHPVQDKGWCERRDEYIREALAEQPAQQQAGEPITQTFTGLPGRKLRDLLSAGWWVSGVCFQRTEEDGTVRRGAITTGGMVLWWNTEQPAQQEVDWEKLYRLEVKKKEALAAKYERDTGKKLTSIIPMAEQSALATEWRKQQDDWKDRLITQHEETILWQAKRIAELMEQPRGEATLSQRSVKPWVHATSWRGLTDEERDEIYDTHEPYADLKAVEAKLKEKNGF